MCSSDLIKCRKTGLKPSAVVVVATVRALKMHGGMPKEELANEDLAALEKGLPNLLRHVGNVANVYKLPAVVAINRFPTDTDREIELVQKKCDELKVKAVLSTVWADGGAGGLELAKEVVKVADGENDFSFAYEDDLTIKQKIEAVATKIYGADGVDYTSEAEEQIRNLERQETSAFPVCIAKTQYSFSDDPKKLGAPKGFRITVRSVTASAGAEFLVVLTGNVLTMPGLPKRPAAENVDLDENGKITGLF